MLFLMFLTTVSRFMEAFVVLESKIPSCLSSN
jgi:hypothetical protein